MFGVGSSYQRSSTGERVGPATFCNLHQRPALSAINVCKMFADDSKIMAKISSAQDSVELQRDLDRVVDWAEKWQASFNVVKFKEM